MSGKGSRERRKEAVKLACGRDVMPQSRYNINKAMLSAVKEKENEQ